MGTALLGGLALGGGTLALWNTVSPVDEATVTTGDLQIVTGTVDGATQAADWLDGATVTTGGQDAAPAAEFLVRPGDIIVLSLPVTAVLQGDNLNATLTASIPPMTPLPGVGLSYQVFDDTGTALSTATTLGTVAQTLAPGGGPLIVEGESDAVVTREYEIRLTVTTSGLPDDLGLPGATIQDDPSQYEVVAALGSVSVTLDQIRTGS